jgi:MFS family permease
MYAIDWPTACPNALTFDKLNDCFTQNNLAESAEIECENGYESVFDQSLFTNTVVTEYQLVCSNAWIETVISTLFMAGLFFGVSIFGPIMDKLGRLNAMMISSIGLFAVQIPLIFIPVSGQAPIHSMNNVILI